MADESDAKIVGTLPDVHYEKLPDKKPSKASDYLFHKIIMTPYIRRELCGKGCTVCRDICGPQAIVFDEKQQPAINYERCIRCYCCTEQCPHQAMWLKGGIINRTIQATRKIMKI
jgi:formate hydrogenlyase subunit 6/NADH:ubiquinone oxidoreductase subunit I